MQIVCGKIRNIDLEQRVFSIASKKKLNFYYLSNSLMKKFQPYMQEGLLVYLKAFDTTRIVGRVSAYEVINFVKIDRIVRNRHNVYYDIATIRQGVKTLINKDSYRLFLDLEFTMPGYKPTEKNSFYSEIVQYGLHLEDSKGAVIESLSGLIRPKCSCGVNERTCSFIHVSKEKIQKAPGHLDFYNAFSDLLLLYQPVIVVWGKNDYLMLNNFYKQHNLKPLTDRKNFVNLMQILKNYYGKKEDIGLYNAFGLFGEDTPRKEQDHDALHDAFATAMIYHLFEKEVNQ